MSSVDHRNSSDLEIQIKYGLRAKSIQRRIEVESKVRAPKPEKRTPKPRSRPPPLSKYRRKTANARERDRMREINDAFEALQKAIPGMEVKKEEKCTKLNTLKLAMNYIKALSDLLVCTTPTSSSSNSPSPSSDSSRSSEEPSSPSNSVSSLSSSPLRDVLFSGKTSDYLEDSFSLDDLPSLPDSFELLLTEEDFSLSTVMDEPSLYR
ncbi:TX [Lepeophtheirus salmonis]|uniref:Protein atonal homolog 7Alike [Metaseiulus occidentalis] n=1 Tax=Lepeophtheirus salmonis TaxID=72036 RepID=A0A0K2TIW2_LEPSM|nr:twist-related protein 2-like [Lepeophtheirus salmonis]CAB4056338.1 TX [Lepeophtheirus salmonis]CAF2796445.1 TX [Lepeophtheirus salmonis]